MQAEVAARNICHDAARYLRPAPATKLKVAGVEVFSVGDVETPAELADVRS